MSIDDERSILFLQPDFDQTNLQDDVGAPLAYVRLGSYKEHEDLSTAALRGDDLLADAGLSTTRYGKFFIDDLREVACSSVNDDASTPHARPTHYDEAHALADDLDATISSPSTTYYRSTEDGTVTTNSARTALSAELLGDGSSTDPRGGWRDHCDGNRISTVRGDRVDVVYGNYKRVVLGRVSGSEVGATSYEMSGGHIFARTSGHQLQHYAIEHVEETSIDGNTRWKVVEREEEGNTVHRFEGKIDEYYDGPTYKQRIGKDAESDTANPEITSRHRITSVVSDTDCSSLTRTLEVDDYVEEVDGDNTYKETYSGMTVHRKRGSWSESGFTFKENLLGQLAVDTRIMLGNGKLETGWLRTENTLGWFIQVKMGIRLAAQVGPVTRLHYGSRCRWNGGGSPWVRMLFAPLNVECNIGVLNTKMSLFSIFSNVDHGEYGLGDVKVSYVRSTNAVGKFKQFAMRAEL